MKGFWGKTRLTSILRNLTTSQLNKKYLVHLGYLSDCTEKRPHDTFTSPTMSVIAYYLTRYPHFNNSRSKKNGKGSTKGFSPSKTATAADSVRHGSERHRCKYRDATWQNRIVRAENVLSIRNIVIKKEGNHLQLLQALLFPQKKKQGVRLCQFRVTFAFERSEYPIISVQLDTSLYPAIIEISG